MVICLVMYFLRWHEKVDTCGIEFIILQNKLEFNNDLVMCSFLGHRSSLLILDRRSTKYETMIQFDGI